jgi:hypothetical protein
MRGTIDADVILPTGLSSDLDGNERFRVFVAAAISDGLAAAGEANITVDVARIARRDAADGLNNSEQTAMELQIRIQYRFSVASAAVGQVLSMTFVERMPEVEAAIIGGLHRVEGLKVIWLNAKTPRISKEFVVDPPPPEPPVPDWIAIGCGAGTGLIALIVFWLWRWRKKQQEKAEVDKLRAAMTQVMPMDAD